MKPEKQNLIRDLLEEDSRREETLLAGTHILRRRRHWRVARQGMALAMVVFLVAMLLMQHEKPRPALAQAGKPTLKPPATQVEALTDDQLLALFPNTPVALASLPDGKKKLIFPRPGDEQRFIKRL